MSTELTLAELYLLRTHVDECIAQKHYQMSQKDPKPNAKRVKKHLDRALEKVMQKEAKKRAREGEEPADSVAIVRCTKCGGKEEPPCYKCNKGKVEA
jgi:hypothetical protein